MSVPPEITPFRATAHEGSISIRPDPTKLNGRALPKDWDTRNVPPSRVTPALGAPSAPSDDTHRTPLRISVPPV